MLFALSIRDFVLVDRLDLSPGSGFTALTGETGAGKSILLDALSVVLGAPAEKRFVREGAEEAQVSAAFDLAPSHPVWALLSEASLEADPGEALTLKRVIRARGAARALVNDQPVSAGLLADLGRELVEIHGQHAASALVRASVHRDLLDAFAGNGALLEECSETFQAARLAREAVEALRRERAAGEAEREELSEAVEKLTTLAPMIGEAAELAAQRTQLMQGERVSGALSEASDALNEGDVSSVLGRAARALEQVTRLPGFDGEGEAAREARAAAEAFERALIEVQEGERALGVLASRADPDPEALEAAESRLFALRAAARRHGVEVDDLPELVEQLVERLASLDDGGAGLKVAEQKARAESARYQAAAERLGAARRAAASRLETRVEAELTPLKLARMRFRVALTPLEAGQEGAKGAESVGFEVATNGASTFAPLAEIASGGEMARLSLALKCALAGAGTAAVLVFDEADQGVGGAVAAAIGHRLAELGAERQVLAITHSPQVAASADAQWRVAKTSPKSGLGRTEVTGLDETERCEEIARMLAGATITAEARAAAERLLEEPWESRTPRRRS